ncbi:MAG: HAMP domain-containing histidine kinase [Clostridia bacterium]|nr:HAMP domain-containing histidine kinase [Clostridia bacterium]
MKKKKWFGLNMTFYFSLVIVLEILLSIGIASGLTYAFDEWFGLFEYIQPPICIFVIGTVVAGGVTIGFNRFFLVPIEKLNGGMDKVTKGDFKFRLDKEKVVVREFRNIYDNFNLMVAELSSMETVQSDFIANVSHEFKTPINAIEGYSMLLQGSGEISDEQRLYIEKILLNTKRLSDLVGNILLLAKLDNQSIQTQSTTFRLDEQVRHAIMLQELKWTEKDIDLDVELDDVSYCGTKDFLLHVWSNLLGNAVKFSPVGGKITVRLQKIGEELVFTIADEGPWIPDDAKTRIFNKFYQGDGAHKEKGNGLGLALAKRIIDINKGAIGVENLPERGCQFTVILKNN